ncbi:MAG: saccharopine dehydrogenase NADP-binding domain-containing protein [Acidobacteriota bacterium]|nr:MAG: saccharopine dehydrogenase NADP-binding domain-containing protein [Acidobacteriota bacterium]
MTDPSAGGVAGARAVVLGAGRQGTAAAYDLGRYGGAGEVLLLDADEGRLEEAAARLEPVLAGVLVRTAGVNAADPAALTEEMRGAAVAVYALPYPLGPVADEAAIEAGCSLVDLGGNADYSRQILELHLRAVRAGVSLVPDTGLAPGLANTLAVDGIGRLDEARSVKIWCGGLPSEPIPPLGYRQVFHIEGLLNEYSGEAVYLRDGKLVRVPALAEIERLELPHVGVVEAFTTSGGTSTAPETFLGRLEHYEYRTVRYSGHRDRFLTLTDLGLLSDEEIPTEDGCSCRPRDLLVRLLAPLIDRPEVPDLVVLRVQVRGSHAGTASQMIYDVFDREDDVSGFTAMERCTAHPAATVAEMAAAGEIEPGARPLEIAVPPQRFLDRFARRPIELTVRGPEPFDE